MLSAVCQSVAHMTGASLMRAKSLATGRIIKLHGVGDDDYSAEQFEAQLQFLARHFSIVTIDEMVETIEAGKSAKDQIVLTFDDGLRNNLTVAYPILQRLKIPATFFVCPGLIENRRWLWTHETRARLKFIGSKQKEIFSRWNATSSNIEQFVEWMKRLPHKKREEVETDLRGCSSGFQPMKEQKNKYDLMTWNEIRSLDSDLITIGSHTVSHPILSKITPEELYFEVAASQNQLEKNLGRIVDYFCYPNGSLNENVIDEVRKVYRAAVTTEVGFVTPSSKLLQLPRIGITEKTSLLAWRLHRPTA